MSTFGVKDSKGIYRIVQVRNRVGNRILPSIVIGANGTSWHRMVEHILNIDTDGNTSSFHEFNALASG